MSVRSVDARGWLQLFGMAALLAGICCAFALSYQWAPWVVAAIVLPLGLVLGAGAVVLEWASDGGYRAHRALRGWLRGGTEPEWIPRLRRRSFLDRQLSQMSTQWWFAGLGALFLALTVWDLTSHEPIRGLTRDLILSAFWCAMAIRAFLLRRHRRRARVLYALNTSHSDEDDPP